MSSFQQCRPLANAILYMNTLFLEAKKSTTAWFTTTLVSCLVKTFPKSNDHQLSFGSRKISFCTGKYY